MSAHAAPSGPVFTPERLAQLEEMAKRYPDRQALLLPALWIAQRAQGWVSPEAITEVAAVLGVSPAHVRGVVTFYTMYHTHPVGRHFSLMCGSGEVVAALLEQTGCGELGATSPDGRFTVIETECLGACGFVTPMLIDDDFIESVTVESVPELLARYP
ncbi:MAG TPA: NAD(P)H-dependent oxidoreductase subunit E [Gemmatimonadales bacterium]|nr:NAD(P)H-dependent oxidoreductase subunit E [Gemmatimonadales bacterium]